MSWLPTLKTASPEEGYELAIKLSRMAVKKPNQTTLLETDCVATMPIMPIV